MAGIKIVNLPALGRNLASTDLFELSLAGGTGSRKITGQEIINAIPSGLTVGSTTIASGAVGQILFQGTGNVLGESGNLFWDNTNVALTLGTTPTSIFTFRPQDTTGTYGNSSSIRGGNGNGRLDFFSASNITELKDNIIILTSVGGPSVQLGSTEISFNVASSTRLKVAKTTGNVLVNTTTDAGYTFDVNGTARVGGNLTVEGASHKIVTSGNTIICQTLGGSVTPLTITAGALSMPFSTLGVATTVSGSTLSLLVLGGASNWNLASGTPTVMESAFGFAPTSGTASFSFLRWNGTINQTGGANGITRGLFIDPTLTSAADFRAIETTRGNVLFGTTSGNVGIGTSTPTSKLYIKQSADGSSDGLIMVGFANTSTARLYVNGSGLWTFNRGGSDAMGINTTGNVLIGTTTDAGYKLDVNGTARISGLLTAAGNYIQYGTNPSVGIGSTNNGNSFVNNGPALLYASANINSTQVYSHNFFTGTFNSTSGVQGLANLTGANFSPTSGTAVFNTINANPTINQTGGANGAVKGFYYNPTLTSVLGTHHAIHTTAGRVRLEGLPTSPAGLSAGDLYNNLGVLMIV